MNTPRKPRLHIATEPAEPAESVPQGREEEQAFDALLAALWQQEIELPLPSVDELLDAPLAEDEVGDLRSAGGDFADLLLRHAAAQSEEEATPSDQFGEAIVARPALPGYELVRQLGSGDFGETWLARREDGLSVALTVRRPGAYAPFLAASALLCRLDHPNLARVFEGGQRDGCSFLVAEFVEGSDLSEWLSAGPDAVRLAQTAAALAGAVEYLHRRRLVHRDIKPANVRISPAGVVKLCDYGLAAALEPDETTERPQTQRAVQGDVAALGRVVLRLLETASEDLEPLRRRCRDESFTSAGQLCQALQALWPLLNPAPRMAVACSLAPAQPWGVISNRPVLRYVENVPPRSLPEPTDPCRLLVARPPGHFDGVVADVGGTQAEIAGYRILQPLGSRAGCDVYLARHPSLGDHLVALKVLRTSSANDRCFARLCREASRLRHPNLVAVSEVGLHHGRAYVVMEYLEGGNLEVWFLSRPALEPERVAGMVEKLACALHVLHQAGIEHRALKPSNVLFDRDGEPHLTDFGPARPPGTEEAPGTPEYLAPERWHGAGGPASDQYALGVILYEALVGRKPFRADDPDDLRRQVLDDPPVPPRHLRPELSRDLEAICLKCLNKEPQRRYRSAAELADDLQRYRQDQPVRARPGSCVERFLRGLRQRRLAAVLLGVLVLLLVMFGLGCFAAVRGHEDDERRQPPPAHLGSQRRPSARAADGGSS
jgi:serine/threonine protein kinase